MVSITRRSASEAKGGGDPSSDNARQNAASFGLRCDDGGVIWRVERAVGGAGQLPIPASPPPAC